jgi:MerR family transcriptional regulator, redox-sensitive transcriptional activator SoxR
MLTIGQVAARTGLRASAIRYYEAQGLLRRPPRLGGKRVYPPSVLEQLAVIELAKIAGFGLHQIRALQSNAGAGEAGAAWRTLISAREAEVDSEMQRLLAIKDVLSKLNGCRCTTLDDCGRAFIEARSKS